MEAIDKLKHLYDVVSITSTPGIGLLVCLPLMKLEEWALHARVSRDTLDVIMAVTLLALSTVIAQIVGGWWYKRRVNQLRSKGYKI